MYYCIVNILLYNIMMLREKKGQRWVRNVHNIYNKFLLKRIPIQRKIQL